MPHKYFYDDSGLPSSYLLLSIILPITLTLTYKYTKTRKVISCKCTNCLKHKKKRQSNLPIIILALLWTLLSYLTKNVLTLKHVSKGYNPYSVLGLDAECTKSQVKSAFRKLAKELDPHKFKEEEKIQANQKFKELTKAYNMINEGIKIDTEASVEVMAIPDWLIGKSTFILVCYAVLLGILLPRYAYSKYKSNNIKNRFEVYYQSIDSFYRRMTSSKEEDTKTKEEESKIDEAFLKGEGCIRGLINYITSTPDFKEHPWRKRVNIKSLVEEKFGYPLKDGDTGYFVLMDHLFRTEMAHPSDLHFVQTKSLQIIQSLKEIAKKKESDLLLERLFTLERMIVQAVFDEEYSDLQVGDSFEEIFLRRKMKKKEKKKEFILPEIKVKEIKAFVEQTNLQEASSVFKEEAFILPEDSKVTISFKVNLLGPEMVHAPFLKEDIFTTWSIFLLVDNKLLSEYKEVKEKEMQIKFMVEGKNKPISVKILFRCGGYFGIDKEESLTLRFVKGN